MKHMTSVKLLRAVHIDTGFRINLLMASNSADLKPVDYSIWNIMQEKVFQTHIANGRVENWLVQVWAELDHRHLAVVIRQWRCCLNACDTCHGV